MKKSKPNELMQLINNGLTPANHGKGGARHNSCSNHLPSHNVIVKGQCRNPKDSKENAVLSLFSDNTDKLMGKSVESFVFWME
jgi:hypothetical protein